MLSRRGAASRTQHQQRSSAAGLLGVCTLRGLRNAFSSRSFSFGRGRLAVLQVLPVKRAYKDFDSFDDGNGGYDFRDDPQWPQPGQPVPAPPAKGAPAPAKGAPAGYAKGSPGQRAQTGYGQNPQPGYVPGSAGYVQNIPQQQQQQQQQGAIPYDDAFMYDDDFSDSFAAPVGAAPRYTPSVTPLPPRGNPSTRATPSTFLQDSYDFPAGVANDYDLPPNAPPMRSSPGFSGGYNNSGGNFGGSYSTPGFGGTFGRDARYNDEMYGKDGQFQEPMTPLPPPFEIKRVVNGKVLLVNLEIRNVKEVRLKGEDDEVLGVFNFREALQMARDREVDLVLINETQTPPLCRLVEWSHYKYETETRDKVKKRQSTIAVQETKEVRLGPKTDDGDVQVKVKQGVKFLEKGNKLKVVMKFEGRELQFKEQGKQLLLRFLDDLSSAGKPEGTVNFKSGSYSVILAPGPMAAKPSAQQQQQAEVKQQAATARAERAAVAPVFAPAAPAWSAEQQQQGAGGPPYQQQQQQSPYLQGNSPYAPYQSQNGGGGQYQRNGAGGPPYQQQSPYQQQNGGGSPYQQQQPNGAGGPPYATRPPMQRFGSGPPPNPAYAPQSPSYAPPPPGYAPPPPGYAPPPPGYAPASTFAPAPAYSAAPGAAPGGGGGYSAGSNRSFPPPPASRDNGRFAPTNPQYGAAPAEYSYAAPPAPAFAPSAAPPRPATAPPVPAPSSRTAAPQAAPAGQRAAGGPSPPAVPLSRTAGAPPAAVPSSRPGPPPPSGSQKPSQQQQQQQQPRATRISK